MDTLQQKQDYFTYGPNNYRIKTAPELDRDLAQALIREELDKSYRFTWGGVVIVREGPERDAPYTIRGDKNACHEIAGRLEPKWIYVRAKQARGVFYLDGVGAKITTTRPELVPEGYIAQVDYRYVDFGQLRWYLEQRVSGDVLVDTKIYDPHESVPEHEWITLMCLNTKLGLYYEPGLEMIDVLKKREWQNRNADLHDVGRAQRERNANARDEAEEAENQQGANNFGVLYNDVLRNVERQTAYSIPNAIPDTYSMGGMSILEDLIHGKR